jgi:hypothetical protein
MAILPEFPGSPDGDDPARRWLRQVLTQNQQNSEIVNGKNREESGEKKDGFSAS